MEIVVEINNIRIDKYLMEKLDYRRSKIQKMIDNGNIVGNHTVNHYSILDLDDEKLKKEVVVDWDVDSDIIAGLVLNIDETIVDNSIKHKLESLSSNIIKG